MKRPARDALLGLIGDLLREVYRLRGNEEQPPYIASAAASRLVHEALAEAERSAYGATEERLAAIDAAIQTATRRVH